MIIKTRIIRSVLLPIILAASIGVKANDNNNALNKALGVDDEVVAETSPDTNEKSKVKEDKSTVNDALKEGDVTTDDEASESEDDQSGSDKDSENKDGSSPDKNASKQSDNQNSEKNDDKAQETTGRDYLEGVTCGDTGPCVVDNTGLPMRALPRSFTALFDNPSDDATMISNAVSAFKPVYVFGVEGINDDDVANVKGWYRVGFTNRRAMGWMRAKDIVEWRQALLLEYLHPGVGSGKRSPVLMFDSQDAIASVVTSGTRKDDVGELLTSVNKGEVPVGVIGKEPAQYLNIDDTFYLLPVIDWKVEPALDEPSHYLQVFAAVPGARADEAGDSTLRDKDYLSEDAFVNVKDSLVDIVFVMDMTGSMQPYIDSVKTAMADMVQLIDASDAEPDKLRFGLVGYRDSITATPQLEWNVKNFTPELVNAEALLAVLDSAYAAEVSSDEWAEDVHGGFLAGVKSAWRTDPNSPLSSNESDDSSSEGKSVRFIMLIGDASGHDMTDEIRGKKNSVQMNVAQLGDQAEKAGIYAFTIYLQDERAEPDWSTAQTQFAELASSETGQGPSSLSVFTADAGKNIGDTVNYIGTQLLCRIDGGDEATCSSTPTASAGKGDSSDDNTAEDSRTIIEIADGLMQAAFADYIGDGANPPKDFLSWVHDYDLRDPYREALGVRVLVTRQQFDNIVRQTANLVDTVEGVVLGNMDFFVALQTTSAKTSLGLDVTADQTLEEQEYLPKWVSSLPYKSAVMAITPAGFANLTPTERKEFQSQLTSKYNAYLEISSSVGRWFKLDESDDKLQEVVALPLTSLP